MKLTHHRNFDFPMILFSDDFILFFDFRTWPLTISMGEIMRPLCCPQKKGP